MKILIGTYRFPSTDYETCHHLINTFRKLGHEVCTAGPVMNRVDITTSDENTLDIDLPDKPYPETYTYKEILDKAPWTPDFILQIEPHFYFTGEKPKDIKSYYWILDPHRGGIGYRNLALQGNFNAIFLTHQFFMESYTSVGMKCYFLPFCFEPERIKYYPEITPECDIAFVGESGIHYDDLVFDKIDNEGFLYCDKISNEIRFLLEYGEYWERAKLLEYLMKKFNVRIYKKYFGDNYCKITQKGLIGFHRSDNNIPPRVFETMACKRALVTDDVLGIANLLTHGENAMIYRQYGYHPRHMNFLLDCESAENVVKDLLGNRQKRNMIAENGYELVHKNHTFIDRAQSIIEIVEEM